MAQALRRRNVPYQLHYTGRTPVDMAFHNQLMAEHGVDYFPYFSRVPGQQGLRADEIMRHAAGDTVFYVCGPDALIEAVRATANQLGIAPDRVQHESFY